MESEGKSSTVVTAGKKKNLQSNAVHLFYNIMLIKVIKVINKKNLFSPIIEIISTSEKAVFADTIDWFLN